MMYFGLWCVSVCVNSITFDLVILVESSSKLAHFCYLPPPSILYVFTLACYSVQLFSRLGFSNTCGRIVDPMINMMSTAVSCLCFFMLAMTMLAGRCLAVGRAATSAEA